MQSASTHGLGWSLKQVSLREVDWAKKLALGVDTEGQYVEVRLGVRRSGIIPRVGQTWLVDRDFGMWCLTAMIDLGAPDLTGGEWLPLTLRNGWSGPTNPEDCAPEARLVNGWIELSGVITGGTVPAVGVDLVVASLADGFPSRYRGNAIVASNLPTGATGYVRAAVTAGGDVTIRVATAYTPVWIDLTGLNARVK
ncbi:hypothetical protein [Streptomyces sp. NPDC088727]|uniref:hypothetical protein n=1 Tax=Streptomyces sp. NPDC088727 TaxID=3365875 RepID=UPI00380B1C2D